MSGRACPRDRGPVLVMWSGQAPDSGTSKGQVSNTSSATRIGVANTLTLRLAGPAHASPADEDSRTMVINPDSVR